MKKKNKRYEFNSDAQLAEKQQLVKSYLVNVILIKHKQHTTISNYIWCSIPMNLILVPVSFQSGTEI